MMSAAGISCSRRVGGESGITCIALRGFLKAVPPFPAEKALRPFAASNAQDVAASSLSAEGARCSRRTDTESLPRPAGDTPGLPHQSKPTQQQQQQQQLLLLHQTCTLTLSLLVRALPA
jgi:hypothetical protein